MSKQRRDSVEVSHILVNYAYEAEDIMRLLANGDDFADLARRYSQCSSARVGGYLGRVKQGKTVVEFEEAAFALSPAQISKPVRTQFGYHLILRSPDRSAEE